jgi:hypothetical protein
MCSSVGRGARPVKSTSSMPRRRNFVPNIPLPAVHIAAGAPPFDVLSGEYA